MPSPWDEIEAGLRMAEHIPPARRAQHVAAMVRFCEPMLECTWQELKCPTMERELRELTDSMADDILLHELATELYIRNHAPDLDDRGDGGGEHMYGACIAGAEFHHRKMRALREDCDLSLRSYLDSVDIVFGFEHFRRTLIASDLVRGVVMQKWQPSLLTKQGACGSTQAERVRKWLVDVVRTRFARVTARRILGALRARKQAWEAYCAQLDEAREVVEEHRRERSRPSLVERLPEELLVAVVRELPACTSASFLRVSKPAPALRTVLKGRVPQLRIFETTGLFPHGWDTNGEAYVVAGSRGGPGGGSDVGLLVGLARPKTADDAAWEAEDRAEDTLSDAEGADEGMAPMRIQDRTVAAHAAWRIIEVERGHNPGFSRVWLRVDLEDAERWTLQSAKNFFGEDAPPKVVAAELVCASAPDGPAMKQALSLETRLARASQHALHATPYPVECPSQGLEHWGNCRWVRRGAFDGGYTQPVYAQYRVHARYLTGKGKTRYRLRLRTDHPGVCALSRPFRVLSKHPAGAIRKRA
jgi:hypothetical protein